MTTATLEATTQDTATAPETAAEVKEVRESKVEAQERKRKDSAMKVIGHIVQGQTAIAVLTPDKLKELAFISTYSTKDSQSTHPRQRGYQREPMDSRFPAIGRYYAKDNNRERITPIIASVRVYSAEGQRKFIKMFNAGDIKGIHRSFTKSAFSIIDGQHRMGGLHWAWENINDFNANIPVEIFFGLRYEEEANLFDDINTNQRRLPKALIEATKVHMEAGKGGHAQEIREIAQALAEDGNSVWYDLVNMSGGQDEKYKPLTFEGMRRSTGYMFPVNVLDRVKQRGFNPEDVAKRYWLEVSKACAVAWNEHTTEVSDDEGDGTMEITPDYRLKDLAGAGAVAMLAKDIFTTSLDRSKDEDEFWDSVSDLVSKLGAVDWEKRPDNPWQIYGAGFAGASGLYRVLFQLVYLDQMPGEAA